MGCFGFCRAYARFLIILGWVLLAYCLYFYNYASFCGWKYENSFARMALVGDPQIEGENRIWLGYYGVVDLLINDIYMNHIIYNIMTFLRPTHMVVMGDILGSQYIPETEFNSRVDRYKFIFQSAINNTKTQLINLVGNHDIGYGVEVDDYLLGRFEAAFGPTNTNLWIKDADSPQGQHLFVVANGQVLDPSRSTSIREKTWHHLHESQKLARKHNATILLAEHIPLHKDAHVCVDVPSVWMTDGSQDVFKSGYVYMQNTLSANATDFILNQLHPKFVFVGHDHEGCIYDHKSRHGDIITEYTLRSMMGDYGGYIGLFEISRSNDGNFQYHFQYCPYMWIKLPIALGITVIVWFLLAGSLALGSCLCLRRR